MTFTEYVILNVINPYISEKTKIDMLLFNFVFSKIAMFIEDSASLIATTAKIKAGMLALLLNKNSTLIGLVQKYVRIP